MNITHLLFTNHPLATKLLSVASACDFVMLDWRELTSRRAARDDTQNDSFGASIICSIYNFMSDWGRMARAVSRETYHSFEVCDLEGRVLCGHLSDLVSLTVHLDRGTS